MAAFRIAGEVLVLVMALARLHFIVLCCWYVVHGVRHGVFRRNYRDCTLYFIVLLCDVVVKNGRLNGHQSVNDSNCYTKKYVSVVLIVRGV